MHPRIRLAVVCSGFIGLCVPTFAASDPAPGAPDIELSNPALVPSAVAASDAWKFTLKTYLWAAGITGDVAVGNLPSQDVDISFGDILDKLDFGAALGLEAKRADQDWTLLFDVFYADLRDERTNADVSVTELMGEIDVACQVGPKWLEVLAGLRYWNVDVAVDPTGPSDASRTKDWVDPIIGARATYTLPDTKWTGQLRADFGGFGVGSESTWQIWGDVRYAFSDSFSANVGYRALDFDYEADNANHDITMSGPVIGILWNF